MKLSNTDVDGTIHGLQLYEKSKRGELLTKAELTGLLPNRDEFAAVYRTLRSGSGFCGSAELLLTRLAVPSIGFAKLLTALDVLAEHCLISQDRFGDACTIALIQGTQKVNLFDSKILAKLNSLGKDGE